MDSPVSLLMNRQFRSVTDGQDRDSVFEMMRRDCISQIPVLDDQGCIVDLLLLQELITPNSFSNAVVIMAGGQGKRLRPFTDNCPKPMLLVDGKPMLQILLEQYIACGFKRFYLSVNYLKEQIIDFFRDGSRFGVEINYLVEDSPLGTAGSLKLMPKAEDEPFVVVNGDVLTQISPIQLLKFHSEHQAAGTVCVREYTTTVPFGVIQTNGVDLIGFEEKPSYRYLVNAGVYVIDPLLLELLSPGQFVDMPTLLENAQLNNRRIVVCPMHEYWIDVGRPEALRQANQEWPGSFDS